MSNAREARWIQVRLRRTTHAMLLKLEAIWREAYSRGAGGLAPDETDRIGLDRIVAELVRRDAEHRRRANPKRAAFAKPVTGSDGGGENPPLPRDAAGGPTGQRVAVDDSSPIDRHGPGVGFGGAYTDPPESTSGAE